MSNLGFVFILISLFWILYRRSLHYLRYFQQEDYRPQRFLKWLYEKKIYDTSITFLLLITCFIHKGFDAYYGVIFLVVSLFVMYREGDPRKEGKLRLNLTERAKNILIASVAILWAVNISLAAFTFFVGAPLLYLIGLIFLVQLIPIYMIAGHYTVLPFEMRKQQRYIDEAKQVLVKTSPYIIGITGSYGKTSTKDALGRILQVSLGPTFWPPKGINALMGITREIRSQMKPGYQYAVIEMGAYGRGSIQRICELTPPQAAIITCVGEAHLERFGDAETIYLAKSELAQAVPSDGILVCNGDNEGTRRIASQFAKKTTLLYGFEAEKGHLDCWISKCKTTSEGTQFEIQWKGKNYQGETPLFGKPALSNVVASFTMACALGADPDYVLAVIKNLMPVENRLQVQKTDEVTFLHDANNSNPIGFSAALEVMKALPGNRRILMTPGMIELGPKQEIENTNAGKLAAQNCDLALIVGPTNQKALVKGLIEGGMPQERIILCATRDKAFAELRSLQMKHDVILIENDLPDLYEKLPCF